MSADADDGADDAPDTQPDALKTIIEAGRFQKVVEVLRSVDDECIFHLGREGLQVNLIDPATAYLVRVDVSASAFDSVGDGAFAIGVNLERLDDMLSKADDGDLVRFVLDLETRKFHIEFTNVGYDLAGIDSSTIRDEPDNPDIDHANEFRCEARHIQRATDVCTLVANYVTITADPDAEHIRFDSEGDTDDAYVTLDEELDFADVTEKTESMVSAGTDGYGSSPGYLTEALNVVPSNAEVTTYVGDEMPIVMEWSFPDADVDVEQLVAPRIQSD